MSKTSETARIMHGLKTSTRRTIARIAAINGITPAQVLGRMIRGQHLDYFAASKGAGIA